METPRIFRIRISQSSPSTPSASPPTEPPPSPFPNWMKPLFTYRQKQHHPTLLGHIALAATAGTIALIGYSIVSIRIEIHLQDSWLKFAPRPEKIEQKNISTKLRADEPSRLRLLTQLADVDERIVIHRNLTIFFYKQYYAILALSSTAGVMASLCLFFISKSGWDRINNAIINLFFSASGITLFCVNLTFVFQYGNNLQGNQDLLFSYIALRNEIASYCATGGDLLGNYQEPANYIHYIDVRMQSLNQIRLGFDASRILDMEDTLKKLLMEKQVTPPVPSPSTSPSKSPKAQ